MHEENARGDLLGFQLLTAKSTGSKHIILDFILQKAQINLHKYQAKPFEQRKLHNIMDLSFKKYCNEAVKSDPNMQLIMNNDSGYVSQNHDPESNSDSYFDNYSTSTMQILRPLLPKPIYLSEDALLERPDLENHNQAHKFASPVRKLLREHQETVQFLSPNMITSSVQSTKTQYSGFETDSDHSIVIPEVNSIYFTLANRSDEKLPAKSCSDHISIAMPEEDSNEGNVEDLINCKENRSCNVTVDMSLEESFAEKSYNESMELDFTCNAENKIGQHLSKHEAKVLVNVTNTHNENMIDINKIAKDNNLGTKRASKTPIKPFKNPVNPEQSPDLFSDEEHHLNEVENRLAPKKTSQEQYIAKEDHKLLKRVQTSLTGVPPPPSVTIVQISVEEMLNKLENNKDMFWDVKNDSLVSNSDSFNYSRSLLVNGGFEDSVSRNWPQILEGRHHGLHYNRSKISEEFEHLCDKFAKRCIGAETQSTCTVFETRYVSPTKRRANKQRWAVKSPGRRLSHLARRRITFSSANLQAGSSSAGSRARQILVDSRKLELLTRRRSPRKSPRRTPRKSPGKSPVKRRTPSSSAKKKLAMRFRLLSGDFKETAAASSAPSTSSAASSLLPSKRLFFQSPDRDSKHSSLFQPSTSGVSASKRSLFTSPMKLTQSTRRSLFSPSKRSPFKHSGFERKRKRTESEEENPNSKFPRSMSSLDIRPCTSEMSSSYVNRSQSEVLSTRGAIDLSVAHKKKLQWAVYEALKTQNITSTHPQFKVFASILARVTRRFILAANGPKLDGGTSERMLRIARHHAYSVVKGKTMEEIITDYNKARTKNHKPQGYVSKDQKENVLQVTNGSEAKKVETLSAPKSETSRIDRIRKCINFEDNR